MLPRRITRSCLCVRARAGGWADLRLRDVFIFLPGVLRVPRPQGRRRQGPRGERRRAPGPTRPTGSLSLESGGKAFFF